jgi:rhodanese-related sulfurtransferase
MKFCKTEVLKILGIALLSAILFNSFSSSNVEYIYNGVQLEEKRVVSLEEAKKLFDAKEVIFLDARPAPIYKRGHIPGALNVPFNSMEKEKLMSDIKVDQPLVVYCYSARCNQASLLDARIRKLGYKNVAVFSGGIVEWTKAKYPLEKED